MQQTYKIIDFHTHPFKNDLTNICSHIPYCNMNMENTKRDMLSLGVQKICGSVIRRFEEKYSFNTVKMLNDQALELQEIYDGFYIPGFHVHPKFVKESIDEIQRMVKLGVKMIGELVPYHQCWSDYSDKDFWEILEVADHYKMIVNFHALGSEEMYCQMDKMVKRFKNIIFVGAHPSENSCLEHHFKRFEANDKYMIDLSGGGLFRHGMLRHVITEFGKERVLFGSDYPTCNTAMFIGGVALDYLLTEEEKEYVFYKNAQRILDIKL